MSNELVPFQQVQEMAAAVARSRLFKAFDTPEKAFVLMMVAQSEGCHPMQAVQRYDVIDGKPSKKSDAMLADFQARGGKVTWNKIDDKEVEGIFEAPGIGRPVAISWTIEMARSAGLTGKANWKGYPRAMLRARVISEGIRTAMPGVVAGLYTPEEVEDFDTRPVVEAKQATPAPRVFIDTSAVDVESTPTPEPAAMAEKASPDQVKDLCIAMTSAGIKDREEVLKFCFTHGGRKVDSRKDLSPQEWSKCIKAAKVKLSAQTTDQPAEPGSEG
jgi:hypothetical protein